MRGFDREQKRVLKRARSWAKRLGLKSWWYLNYQCIGELIGETSEAKTVADWKLREATINFHLEETIVMDDDDLDNLILHELVHLMVDPLAPQAKEGPELDLLEYVTETVARAILRVTR